MTFYDCNTPTASGSLANRRTTVSSTLERDPRLDTNFSQEMLQSIEEINEDSRAHDSNRLSYIVEEAKMPMSRQTSVKKSKPNINISEVKPTDKEESRHSESNRETHIADLLYYKSQSDRALTVGSKKPSPPDQDEPIGSNALSPNLSGTKAPDNTVRPRPSVPVPPEVMADELDDSDEDSKAMALSKVSKKVSQKELSSESILDEESKHEPQDLDGTQPENYARQTEVVGLLLPKVMRKTASAQHKKE